MKHVPGVVWARGRARPTPLGWGGPAVTVARLLPVCASGRSISGEGAPALILKESPIGRGSSEAPLPAGGPPTGALALLAGWCSAGPVPRLWGRHGRSLSRWRGLCVSWPRCLGVLAPSERGGEIGLVLRLGFLQRSGDGQAPGVGPAAP